MNKSAVSSPSKKEQQTNSSLCDVTTIHKNAKDSLKTKIDCNSKEIAVQNGNEIPLLTPPEVFSKCQLSTNNKLRNANDRSNSYGSNKSPVNDNRKKKTPPLTNSFSKEKRETLRRLLNASGGKELNAPVFSRQKTDKIDTYKLSLTFPGENAGNSKSTSRSGTRSRSRSRGRSRSRESAKGRSRSNSVIRSSNGQCRSRSKSEGRDQITPKDQEQKAPESKWHQSSVPALSTHFRKLTKQELGKNNLRGSQHTLSLTDNTPKNTGFGNTSATPDKRSLMPNGRPLRFSGPLLPTPTR